MTARALAKRQAIEESARHTYCPAEFATTDRICQRWAVSVGLGVQSDKWQDSARSRPPPLDDDMAIIVDQIILKLPEKTKRVVVKWYRTDLPNGTIAEQLRLTPENLIVAWHLSLNFLQHKFVGSGHKGLLAALRFRE
jgi:DNA-directed RNA polymerase specialized sigma24 family protein